MPDGTSVSKDNNDVVRKLRLYQKLLNAEKKGEENPNAAMHRLILDDPICGAVKGELSYLMVTEYANAVKGGGGAEMRQGLA